MLEELGGKDMIGFLLNESLKKYMFLIIVFGSRLLICFFFSALNRVVLSFVFVIGMTVVGLYARQDDKTRRLFLVYTI